MAHSHVSAGDTRSGMTEAQMAELTPWQGAPRAGSAESSIAEGSRAPRSTERVSPEVFMSEERLRVRARIRRLETLGEDSEDETSAHSSQGSFLDCSPTDAHPVDTK